MSQGENFYLPGLERLLNLVIGTLRQNDFFLGFAQISFEEFLCNSEIILFGTVEVSPIDFAEKR